MMKTLKTGFFMLSVFLLSLTKADAQVVAAKTNFLYWGTTTPNLSLEFGLGKRTTLDIMGGYNPFTFGSDYENKKIQHWVVQPELRLWKCERFNRGFWGFHAHYGQFNMGGALNSRWAFSKVCVTTGMTVGVSAVV